MEKLWKINFFVLILFVFSLSAFGQSNAQIEKELVAAIKDVQKYSNYGSGYDKDKLSKANDVFEEKLLKYTKISSTLNYKFSELSELLIIAASDDGRFRIYSWDMEDGGTMHDYSSVYQYQGADGKVYSKTDEKTGEEEGGAGSFVYDIFTADSKTGKIYIVCSTFIASTMDDYGSADLYKINGNKLIDKVKSIKTNSGMTDSLHFEYNGVSAVNHKEIPLKLIVFDKKTNTLKIPLIVNDKDFPNGKVTNRFISYKFDGTSFVKIN